MSEAFDTSIVAKPGVRVWEAAAVAEEVLKNKVVSGDAQSIH
jgi:hypothetical protein